MPDILPCPPSVLPGGVGREGGGGCTVARVGREGSSLDGCLNKPVPGPVFLLLGTSVLVMVTRDWVVGAASSGESEAFLALIWMRCLGLSSAGHRSGGQGEEEKQGAGNSRWGSSLSMTEFAAELRRPG